jgi:hypothetical protein
MNLYNYRNLPPKNRFTNFGFHFASNFSSHGIRFYAPAVFACVLQKIIGGFYNKRLTFPGGKAVMVSEKFTSFQITTAVHLFVTRYILDRSACAI